MENITAAIVFGVTWWLVFFVTLPFGIRKLDNPEGGMDPGAPQRPRLWIKAGVTTVIAITITLLVKWGMDANLISFRQ